MKQEEKCIIGSVEFMNPLDFMKRYNNVFNIIKNNSFAEIINNVDEICERSDLIAQVKIKNRDTKTAIDVTDEVMKRVYTLVRLIIPRISYQHRFFGAFEEEYLDTKYSLLLKFDESSNITSLMTGQTKNYFSDNELNLLEEVAKYQEIDTSEEAPQWFIRGEFIISRYVNGEDLTDFQERVWTALYWLGESMIEREINSLIIKYATCLEALFNNREGGISEQIAEFTAFIVGGLKDDKISIYDDIKKLYKLRSNAVHGGNSKISVNDIFLNRVQQICEFAVINMMYYSCDENWKNQKGYQNFIRYILREYRFS